MSKHGPWYIPAVCVYDRGQFREDAYERLDVLSRHRRPARRHDADRRVRPRALHHRVSRAEQQWRTRGRIHVGESLRPPSTLPFRRRRSTRSRTSDYQPAIEEGMRAQLAEIEAIANQTAGADVRQHDRGDGAIGRAADARVEGVLRASSAPNTNDTLQKIQADRGAEARRAQRRDLSQRRSCSSA